MFDQWHFGLECGRWLLIIRVWFDNLIKSIWTQTQTTTKLKLRPRPFDTVAREYQKTCAQLHMLHAHKVQYDQASPTTTFQRSWSTYVAVAFAGQRYWRKIKCIFAHEEDSFQQIVVTCVCFSPLKLKVQVQWWVVEPLNHSTATMLLELLCETAVFLVLGQSQ